MNSRAPRLGTVALIIAAAAGGCASAYFVALPVWTPALSGLLTALSLLAGAALVRMARNVPITSPSTFDDDELRRFFETLEALAQRLFWVFAQTLGAVALVLVAMVLTAADHPRPWFYDQICMATSGALAFSMLWLSTRMLSMAKGDIGFIRLQRLILENAVARERRKEAARVVASPVTRVTPGRFGSAG